MPRKPAARKQGRPRRKRMLSAQKPTMQEVFARLADQAKNDSTTLRQMLAWKQAEIDELKLRLWGAQLTFEQTEGTFEERAVAVVRYLEFKKPRSKYHLPTLFAQYIDLRTKERTVLIDAARWELGEDRSLSVEGPLDHGPALEVLRKWYSASSNAVLQSLWRALPVVERTVAEIERLLKEPDQGWHGELREKLNEHLWLLLCWDRLEVPQRER